MYLHKI